MKSIRGLDEELYQQARIQALKEGKPNVGQWINEAIKFYLKNQQKKGKE